MSPEEIALSAGLSPGEFSAFYLACQGQDAAGVSLRLGISLGAARMRLCRAGKRLREVRRHQEAQAELDELLSLLEGVFEKR